MYDINDYIEGIVPLGSPMLCPFHDDNSPSAYCTPNGTFYCFVCCISCDQLECVKRIWFPEEDWSSGLSLAAAFMRKYGTVKYVYKKEVVYTPPDSQTIEALTEWQRITNRNLQSSPVLETIKKERALKDPIKLGIGLASYECFLQMKKFDEDTLIKTGILYPLDNKGLSFNSRYKLLNRLILPEIRSGKCIYYQSRAQEREHKFRYINPKGLSRPVYGWESLYRKTPFIWFVEGVFDMLPLVEAGESVICCNGLGFNDQILEDISTVRNNRPIAVVFDNDKPDARGDSRGQIESLKRVERLRAIGIESQSIIPPYKDVGEWVTIEGVEEVIASITLRM